MEFSIAMLVCKVYGYGYGRTPMAWGDHTRIPNMELLDTGVFSLFLEGGSAQTCLFHLKFYAFKSGDLRMLSWVLAQTGFDLANDGVLRLYP